MRFTLDSYLLAGYAMDRARPGVAFTGFLRFVIALDIGRQRLGLIRIEPSDRCRTGSGNVE
jgi:hypothetical protein